MNEKLTLNEKINLWIEDGYGIKFCNRIGAIMIVIGILILVISSVNK